MGLKNVKKAGMKADNAGTKGAMMGNLGVICGGLAGIFHKKVC